MTDIRIVACWAALSCCLMVLGRMLGNSHIATIGLVMAVGACAFAC